MTERIVGTWPLDDSGDRRALVDGERFDSDIEVHLGCGLKAVGPLPEVDRVEVALEDLLLAELLFDLARESRFLNLSLVGLLGYLAGGDDHLLYVLLGDRRATLLDLTRADIGERCPDYRFEVDALMLVEALVLDRDDSILNVFGNCTEVDDRSVLLAMEALDQGPVVREELGRLGRIELEILLGQLGEIADPIRARRSQQPEGREGKH